MLAAGREMIYVKLPTGDHGWGVVGDSLANALSEITPIHRLGDDARAPQVVSGPLLQQTGLTYSPQPGLGATRHVAYAVFEEDLTARRAAKETSGFDAIATACRWCENVLREAGLSTVTTIPHGVHTVRFSPARAVRRRHLDRFVVFSGGKFELRKGQDIVVRAFKAFAARHDDAVLVAAWHNPWKRIAHTMAASPHFPLTIADDRSFDDLLQRWLVGTGLDLSRVELVPRLANADLAAIYGNSDVGLFPNRCEGATNLVMMEYMACGRPVVATDFSGHRDILTEANSLRLRRWRLAPFFRDGVGRPVAMWCEPDVDEIVEALEYAYHDRSRLAALGCRAAADLSEFTWERAARSFLPLLEPGWQGASSPTAGG